MFAAAGARYGSGMRITCPACASVYELPDSRIVPGRAVRCARCGTDWAPHVEAAPVLDALPAVALGVAPAPERIVEDDPASAPTAPLPPTEPADPAEPAPSPTPVLRRQGRRGVLVLAWVASFAALGALAASAVHWRADLMRVWPPSARAYAALGLLPAPEPVPSGH